MHSSLNFLVSGQAQQIFFFGLDSGVGAAAVETLFCLDWVPGRANAEVASGGGGTPII